jgi:hypothetical protein
MATESHCASVVRESRSALMNERKSQMEDLSSLLSWASGCERENDSTVYVKA